jgi:hypothetical protein
VTGRTSTGAQGGGVPAPVAGAWAGWADGSTGAGAILVPVRSGTGWTVSLFRSGIGFRSLAPETSVVLLSPAGADLRKDHSTGVASAGACSPSGRALLPASPGTVFAAAAAGIRGAHCCIAAMAWSGAAPRPVSSRELKENVGSPCLATAAAAAPVGPVSPVAAAIAGICCIRFTWRFTMQLSCQSYVRICSESNEDFLADI